MAPDVPGNFAAAGGMTYERGILEIDLIFWGQNDIFFTPEGGEAYLRDLPNAEIHRLDSGHFAVKDCLEEISNNICRFYESRVAKVLVRE